MQLDDGKFGFGIKISINLRMSVLVDFEKLCLFDNARNVASNVFLLIIVPWQTGCSSSDRSSPLE